MGFRPASRTNNFACDPWDRFQDGGGTQTVRVGGLYVSALLAVLAVVVSGCGWQSTGPPQSILGRWQVLSAEGMNVPNSFFWFSMDYLEFREDGQVWALIDWPPETGSHIRLNKTAEYALVGADQIQFVGACRHQDPCIGTFTATMRGDELRIFDAEGRLELKRVGPPSKELPPTVAGPSPTQSPAVTQ